MEDLRQCRIVIRESAKGDTIADTTILESNVETGEIVVAIEGFALAQGDTISALIFSKSGLYETQGTIGVLQDQRITIALYEGSDKDDRHAVRYQVNITGMVDSITRQGEKLSGEFELTVLNMSSIGLLVQAPEGRIKEDDVIRFSAVTKGQRIIITAQATRVEEVDKGKEKIGCTVQLVNLG